MKSDVPRLCLGTAQFGSHYGATNKTGKPSQDEIKKILDCARGAGIQWMDWGNYNQFIPKAWREGFCIMRREPPCLSIYPGDPVPPWCEKLQFPLSIADRRLLADLPGYRAYGIRLFARSVFLQGNLLQMGYSVADCLGFVLRQPIDYAIVGVNSVRELEEIMRAAHDLPEQVPDIPDPMLAVSDIDPRTW